MKVQIAPQSFFDLVNKADSKGEPYSFTRLAPANSETAKWHIELVSEELGLTVHIERSSVPGALADVSFHLDLGEEA